MLTLQRKSTPIRQQPCLSADDLSHVCCVPGVCVQGRTAQRFRTVITLGVLSFNKYQPTDLKVRRKYPSQAASLMSRQMVRLDQSASILCIAMMLHGSGCRARCHMGACCCLQRVARADGMLCNFTASVLGWTAAEATKGLLVPPNIQRQSPTTYSSATPT